MIGIKISNNSKLPERLKTLSQRLGMDYEQMLEKWICSEENPEQLNQSRPFLEDEQVKVKPQMEQKGEEEEEKEEGKG